LRRLDRPETERASREWVHFASFPRACLRAGQPGNPFFDPEADQALFNELERLVKTGSGRRIVRHPFHINDAAFAEVLQREIAQLQIR